MNLKKGVWLGLWCLALWASPASPQEDLWKRDVAAGRHAYQEGRYAEAERLFQSAIKEAERFGPEDPRVATTLNNLAELYRAQRKYAQAEPLYRRALAINEKTLGPAHPNVGATLHNLAGLYHAQGKYAQAESL